MKLQFDIEKFSTVKEVEEEQYAIVEVYIVSDGNNRHDKPISLSTIKKAAKTLKNKFLVASYDGDDFMGHEPDEVIIGVFPESGKTKYVKKDGKTFLVAEAILSKVYSTWAYDLFVEENHKGVSMEISVTKEKEVNGKLEISEFVFNGVTVLGDDRTPAIDGADAKITKFEVEEAAIFYSKYSWESNVVKNSIDFEEDEGKEEEDNMQEEVKENIEQEEISEEVVLSEEISEEVVETEVAEVAEEVDTDVEADFEEEVKEEKEVSMDEDSKEEDDEEEEDDKKDNKFESLTSEQKYIVMSAACRGIGYLENFDDEYIYVYSYADGEIFRYDYTLSGTDISVGETGERVMRGGYVVFEEISKTEVNPELESLKEENEELKEKISKYEVEQRDLEVEAILSSVVDELSVEEISNLRDESKNFSIENLSEFSNKVRALAFESVKKESKYSFARISFGETQVKNSTGKFSW